MDMALLVQPITELWAYNNDDTEDALERLLTHLHCMCLQEVHFNRLYEVCCICGEKLAVLP